MSGFGFGSSAAVAFSAATLAMAFAQPAVAQSAGEVVDWKVGQVLTYVSRDMWNKEIDRWQERVLSKEGGVYVVDYQGGSGDVQFKVEAATGMHTRPMPWAGEGRTFSYLPVKLPMQQGDEWEWTYHYIGRVTQQPSQNTRKCKAGETEEVKAAAGTFTATKITCRGGWQSTAGSTGMTTSTMWYAPSISARVKWIEESSYFGGRDKWTVTLDGIEGR